MKDNVSGAALLVALGLAAGGYLIGKGIVDFKRADRYVTVRGVAEREAKGDLAIWQLQLRTSGRDLAGTQSEMESATGKLIAFLKGEGFTQEQIERGNLRVIDRQAQEYSSAPVPETSRYIMTAQLTLRTTDVDRVHAMSQKVSDLVKAGVVLASDNNCGNVPRYLFTRLDEVKPEMVAEATKDARRAAEQFAADSGSGVGNIRNATQGYFSIEARDSVGENYGYECGQTADLSKKIRVVTSVDYYLKD